MKTKKLILLGAITMLLSTTSISYAIVTPHPTVVVNQKSGKEIVVEGTNNKKTIKASANDVVKIAGADNKITIEGTFLRLEVEGRGNVVNLVNTSKISVEGADNRINAGNVDTVTVEGAQNHVHYKSTKNKSGKADTSIEGADNMVMKIK
ncbi:DUF3060 domain-containing protein [Sphingobacterium sp. SRCM116780]|uniref:DUF3060 domain-containing protein n=1 Tax=Sphingobacterium sp. SRCM116780 TaxID=2907623 RepID=UPI001F2EA008|nr:DUF3060 domain-containing protein [Sphingobacterium sp. SRCM116780]UIR57050.1 DUF3060 domain-containing protein [Sphingobacterium sp. SRCM116780]